MKGRIGKSIMRLSTKFIDFGVSKALGQTLRGEFSVSNHSDRMPLRFLTTAPAAVQISRSAGERTELEGSKNGKQASTAAVAFALQRSEWGHFLELIEVKNLSASHWSWHEERECCETQSVIVQHLADPGILTVVADEGGAGGESAGAADAEHTVDLGINYVMPHFLQTLLTPTPHPRFQRVLFQGPAGEDVDHFERTQSPAKTGLSPASVGGGRGKGAGEAVVSAGSLGGGSGVDSSPSKYSLRSSQLREGEKGAEDADKDRGVVGLYARRMKHLDDGHTGLVNVARTHARPHMHTCTHAHARARRERERERERGEKMTGVVCGAVSLPSSPKLEPGVAGIGGGPMSPIRVPTKSNILVPSRLSPMRDDEVNVHGSDVPSLTATPEKKPSGEVGEGGCKGQEEKEEEDLFESLRVQSQGLKVASFLLRNQSQEDVVLVPMSSLDIVVQVNEPPDLAKILSKRLQAARAQAEADSAEKAASQKTAEAAELAAEAEAAAAAAAAEAAAAAAEKQDVDGGSAEADKTDKDGSKVVGGSRVENHVEKAACAAAAAAEAERADKVAAVKAAAATAAALAAQTHGGEGVGEGGEMRQIGGGGGWGRGSGEEEMKLQHRRVGMHARQVGGEIFVAAGQSVRLYLAGMSQPYMRLHLTSPPDFSF